MKKGHRPPRQGQPTAPGTSTARLGGRHERARRPPRRDSATGRDGYGGSSGEMAATALVRRAPPSPLRRRPLRAARSQPELNALGSRPALRDAQSHCSGTGHTLKWRVPAGSRAVAWVASRGKGATTLFCMLVVVNFVFTVEWHAWRLGFRNVARTQFTFNATVQSEILWDRTRFSPRGCWQRRQGRRSKGRHDSTCNNRTEMDSQEPSSYDLPQRSRKRIRLTHTRN